jgi:hypothetical protein
MIDWDDVDFGILGLPVVGVISGIIAVVVIGFLIWAANDNEKECQKRECPAGQEVRLMDNDCLCVSKAK